MLEPLELIGRRIFQSRGILYEGDIFSILLHSPFVIRAFEFALADFAIDCTRTYDKAQSFAQRFWTVYQHGSPKPGSSDLLLAEVKCSVAGAAGSQAYITTRAQRRRVAFYIGINAADPSFVDVIPNYDQEKAALDEDASEEERIQEHIVNSTRVSSLPSSAYAGLDPCSSPYRMPIFLLNEAIRRVRRYVLTGEPYINPWTGTSFDDWKPLTTKRAHWLCPAEHTSHYSACKAVLEIFRNVQGDRMKPDFIGLQPYLADFKLTVLGVRPMFVQHKLDDTLRALDNRMEQVTIARGEGDKRRWYFSAFDRFDFLWYQFRFSSAPGEKICFFFIPEKELPDAFYVTSQKHVSFNRDNFKRFFIEMDEDGEWVGRVEQIIRENPSPRSDCERPARPQKEVDAAPAKPAADGVDGRQWKGRKEYRQVLDKSRCRFFASIMKLCAERGFGLLIVLPTNHSIADLGYLRYCWDQEEREAFLAHGRVPVALQHLPADTEFVPICYYTQYAEATSQGPAVRPQQFRRLDASEAKRLVLWDLAGPDGNDERPHIPVLIPSDDIHATHQQRETFKAVLENPNVKGLPILSGLLNTGLLAAQYGVGEGGPPALQERTWADMLHKLDQFLSFEDFSHPAGCVRHPADYRYTLRAMNQDLLKEHRRWGVRKDPYEV